MSRIGGWKGKGSDKAMLRVKMRRREAAALHSLYSKADTSGRQSYARPGARVGGNMEPSLQAVSGVRAAEGYREC